MMVIRDSTRSDNLKEQKIYIFADNCLGNQRKSYSSKRFFLDAQRRFRLALRFFRFAQPRIKTRRLTKQRDVYLHKLLLSCFQKKQKAQEVFDSFLCLLKILTYFYTLREFSFYTYLHNAIFLIFIRVAIIGFDIYRKTPWL